MYRGQILRQCARRLFAAMRKKPERASSSNGLVLRGTLQNGVSFASLRHLASLSSDGNPTMATTLGNFDATHRTPAPDADERSIGDALRVTVLFVAVVVLLLWAGLADAGANTDSALRATGPEATSSSPTLR